MSSLPIAAVLLPVRDLLRGESRCIARRLDVLLLLLGVVAAWWLYVPVHELLHALACVVAGGNVSRLEIDPIYGGALLARVLPWVVAGGDYAGRLSGFDTHGSDGIYLATDLGPFLLTIFPGVWALRRAARAERPLLFGMAAPLAFAPIVSLGGDMYEIGSVLTTRLPPWQTAASALRGDDVARVASELSRAGAAPITWLGFAAGCVLALLAALALYWAGAGVGRALGEPALS